MGPHHPYTPTHPCRRLNVACTITLFLTVDYIPWRHLLFSVALFLFMRRDPDINTFAYIEVIPIGLALVSLPGHYGRLKSDIRGLFRSRLF